MCIGVQWRGLRVMHAGAGEVQRAHLDGHPSVTQSVHRIRPLPLASQHALERLPDQRKWSEPCSRMSRVGWQLLRRRARRVTSSRTIAIGGVVCGGLIQSRSDTSPFFQYILTHFIVIS